ncbi:MAG TPA: hemolysin family protein, partial [Anaerolineaceae bacterium]|nr:hemolysin family protein [Anaerolineaceae bacterium]
MNNAWLEVILIFLLIILNGVFAMAELALVSARKVRLQQRADDGDRGARAAIELAEDPNRLLSTVQVGITLVGILVGAVGGATVAERLAEQLNDVPWLADIASGLALAIVVLLSTYFSLVIGELIPKRLAMNNPEKVATALSQPMRVLAVITTPVIKLLSWSTNAGLRILGTRPNEEPSVTEEEIKVMIEQGGQVGLFGEAEQDMVEGVMRLGDQSIDAIMTPRTEIEWIDLDEPFEVIRSQIIASQHTRFPVAQSSL